MAQSLPAQALDNVELVQEQPAGRFCPEPYEAHVLPVLHIHVVEHPLGDGVQIGPVLQPLPVLGTDAVDAVGGHAEVHLGPALPQKIGHTVQIPGPHRHHFHALGYAVRSISVDCRTRPTVYISDTHPC